MKSRIVRGGRPRIRSTRALGRLTSCCTRTCSERRCDVVATGQNVRRAIPQRFFQATREALWNSSSTFLLVSCSRSFAASAIDASSAPNVVGFLHGSSSSEAVLFFGTVCARGCADDFSLRCGCHGVSCVRCCRPRGAVVLPQCTCVHRRAPAAHSHPFPIANATLGGDSSERKPRVHIGLPERIRSILSRQAHLEDGAAAP